MIYLIKKYLKKIVPYTSYIKYKVRKNEKRNKQKGMLDFFEKNQNIIIKKRICIFAFYSNNGLISDIDVYYIKELSKYFSVILVGDCKIYCDEFIKIKNYVVIAKFQRHYKYDFGSYYIGYRLGIENHIICNGCDLLLANNSCIGPIFDIGSILKNMNEKDCDFWGLNSSLDYNYHIQSYFIYFHYNVLGPLAKFLSKVRKQDFQIDVIRKYELKLTLYLNNLGYKSESWIPLHDDFIDKNKLTHNKMAFPILLIDKYNCPFIKKKIFINHYDECCADNSIYVLEKIKEKNLELYELIKKDCF